jgi:5-methylcytosine-specific restriction endonuclease McrA
LQPLALIPTLIFLIIYFLAGHNSSPYKPAKTQPTKPVLPVEPPIVPRVLPDTTNIEYPFSEPEVDNTYLPPDIKQAYLKSSEWAARKQQRNTQFAHNCCESCGLTKPLELHHITYKRLTQEHISDVALICRDCHQAIHNKLGYRRETTYPIK